MKYFIGVTFEHNGVLLKEGETYELEFTEEDKEKYRGLYREVEIENVTKVITEEKTESKTKTKKNKQ